MKIRKTHWIFIVIIINFIVFSFEYSPNALRDSEYFYSIGGFQRGNNIYELWRALSCQFIHSGFFHLFTNMISLFYVVKELNKYESEIKIFLSYLFSLIVVAVALIIFAKNNLVYIGNSGAVFGLYATLFFNKIKEKKKLSQCKSEIEIIILMIGLSVVIPSVSILMHLSGFVGGLIFSFASNKKGIYNR